jgi:phage terminase large subunit-like protein
MVWRLISKGGIVDKDQVREVILIARDLEMAVSIKVQIDSGEQRGLARFADGEDIKMPIPQETIAQLDNKIKQLQSVLKERVKNL